MIQLTWMLNAEKKNMIWRDCNNPHNRFYGPRRIYATLYRQVRYLLFLSQWYHHDDVIKWKHFPRYWLFVRVIRRSQVNFPHKGQWRGALKFSFICAWTNGWANHRDAGDLRRHGDHYDVIVMCYLALLVTFSPSVTDDAEAAFYQSLRCYNLTISWYSPLRQGGDFFC